MKKILSIAVLAVLAIGGAIYTEQAASTNAPGIRTQSSAVASPGILTNFLYVSKAGSDTSGSRNSILLPFKTITAAKNAAVFGDTIIVHPGIYAENNLLKNGVNLFFEPGAVVSFLAGGINTNNNVTLIQGIFDDRGNGACTNVIGGYGTFICQVQGYLLCKGTLVVTNAASDIRLTCKDISYSIWQDLSTAMGTRAAICVFNAGRVEVNCGKIYDGNKGTTYQPGVLDWMELATCVYWQLGDLHIHCNSIEDAGSYCVWGDQPNPNSTAANMYIDANYTAGLIYMDGPNGTYNWRTWLNIKEARVGINYFDGGKHYLTCQKMDGAGNGLNFNGAPQVWVTAQKITYSSGNAAGWITLLTGNGGSPTVFADVQQFEDTVSGASITINAGVLNLRAESIVGLGTPSQKALVIHNGGTARITGALIDNSAVNNANNNPVKVAGSGLILDRCTLVAPALADSVTASSAQTITSYGVKANKAKNANVTVNVDAITVDTNVK